MTEGYPRRERKFPDNKYGIDPEGLYDAAAYFYFTPDIVRIFWDRLKISPITEEMIQGLEVYKPQPPGSAGITAEEFRRLREERNQQRRNSAEALVNLIDDYKGFPKFLDELDAEPGDPEYEFAKFLKQFRRDKDEDKAYQLTRILAELKAAKRK